MIELLGTLNLDGGTLLVTDPCYVPYDLRPDLVCAIDGIPAGAYPVWIEVLDTGEAGIRVASLKLEVLPGPRFIARQHVGEAAVDSGQMSFLPESALADWQDDLPGLSPEEERDRYERMRAGEHDLQHPFDLLAERNAGRLSYAGVSGLTLHGHGGVQDGRIAVSSSGYGDGVYPVEVYRTTDDRIALVVVQFLI